VAPFQSEPRLDLRDYGPAIDAKKHDDFSRGRSYFDVAFGTKDVRPRTAPGGLMLSGGLLGRPSGGLGAFIPDDVVAPSRESKPIKKSGKNKRPPLPPGLY
jgi:hypothetical protein